VSVSAYLDAGFLEGPHRGSSFAARNYGGSGRILRKGWARDREETWQKHYKYKSKDKM